MEERRHIDMVFDDDPAISRLVVEGDLVERPHC
jgi:hypothetical protein